MKEESFDHEGGEDSYMGPRRLVNPFEEPPPPLCIHPPTGRLRNILPGQRSVWSDGWIAAHLPMLMF